MRIFIKNMVSLRCKMLVNEELEKLGINNAVVDLGEIELIDDITENKRLKLKESLLRSGLELMEDNKAILIEKIKTVIINMIHFTEELPKVNYSDYISDALNYNYTYLSNIFKEEKGMTIQHFIIMHKIEKVKELLLYDELTLSEISYRLHYSSTAHLSWQFKKITGISPSSFRHLKLKRKTNLEDL